MSQRESGARSGDCAGGGRIECSERDMEEGCKYFRFGDVCGV